MADIKGKPVKGDERTDTQSAEKIRREYEAVPQDVLAAGRHRILEELLGREAIFSTAWGERWEEPARRNIARALGG